MREFSAPQAPAAPDTPSASALASDLSAYAAAEPDHAESARAVGQAAADAGGGLSISAYLKEAAKPIEIHAAAH